MPIKRLLPWLLATAACVTLILFVHRMIKLPSEPFWASPALIYENYAFAFALMFSLPYPYLSATVVLVLVGVFWYWVGRWIIRLSSFNAKA